MRAPLARCLVTIWVTWSCLTAVSAVAAPVEAPDYAWLDDLCLVVLDTADPTLVHAALAEVHAAGGRIGIVSPPALLLGWIPAEARGRLVGRAGIRSVVSQEFSPSKAAAMGASDAQSRRMLAYFNAVKRGEYQEASRQQYSSPGAPKKLVPDARPRGEIEEVEYLRNLEANGFDLDRLRAGGALVGKAGGSVIAGNSDRMTGTVTVTLLFVESDGTGADPNQYTWTDQHVQQYIAGVNTGLLWWTQQADNYNDCWVAFFVRYIEPTDPRNNQWREMVLHPSNDVDDMVLDIMANYGYDSGTHTTRVTAFNTAQKALYGTTWSYTAFVAYNPPGSPAELTDTKSAFAYLLGPYTFLLYRSYGWAPEQVFTHESGHIFGACDEYAGACGCTCSSLARIGPNSNCEDCGGTGACMMKINNFLLCSWTDEQLGWHDATPCAPPALAPPVVNSSSPSFAYQGTQATLTVNGTGFLYGATVSVGSGITVESLQLVSSTELQVSISVATNATVGMRSVSVTNRDNQVGTLPNAFEVGPTWRHYVSPAGGNVFPYHTVANAATTIAAAISAAGNGDSILVDSTTINLGSLTIDRGVVVYGGWTSNFSSRDPVNTPTRLNLTSANVSIVSGTSPSGLDGFVIRNGVGIFNPLPFNGKYGGCVAILNSTALVRNVEIQNGVGALDNSYSGGGGIFAAGSTLMIDNVQVSNCAANLGGGMFLFTSSGSITNSSFVGNAIAKAPQGGLTTQGAGIYMNTCSNLTLDGLTIESNTGANTGGGIHVTGSSGIVFLGGAIRNHTVNDPTDGASDDGGGVYVDASDVDFIGTEISGNVASFSGGGIYIGSGSDVVLSECSLLSNSALLHGGLHALGATVAIRHNLFAINTGNALNGAVALQSVTNGEFLGNTVYGNISLNGAAGLSCSDSPIPVSNNIFANSTGLALQCLGTALPTLSYNLMYANSGGDYDGCTAGTGSLSADPLFVDPGQDFHLGLHSPGIDAGRPDAGYDDPDGSPGDLGWYGSHSFSMSQPAFPQNLSGQLVSGEVLLEWNANSEPDLASYAVYGDSVSNFVPSAATFLQLVAAPATSVNLGAQPSRRYFRIAALDTDGYASGYSNVALVDGATSAPGLQPQFRVLGAVPNPFNPMTRIDYELDRTRRVDLSIYDMTGRLVRRLVQEAQPPGVHAAVWNGLDDHGRNVSSGVYLYRLQSEDEMASARLILLK